MKRLFLWLLPHWFTEEYEFGFTEGYIKGEEQTLNRIAHGKALVEKNNRLPSSNLDLTFNTEN